MLCSSLAFANMSSPENEPVPQSDRDQSNFDDQQDGGGGGGSGGDAQSAPSVRGAPVHFRPSIVREQNRLVRTLPSIIFVFIVSNHYFSRQRKEAGQDKDKRFPTSFNSTNITFPL